MPRNLQVNFKMTHEEREFVDEVCEEINLSRADLYLQAVDYLINEKPKEYKRLIKRGKQVKKLKEVKSNETKTGDFLGSFEKFDGKLARIEERFKEGRFGPELREMLIDEATEDYSTSQKIHTKDLKRRRKKGRRKT